MRTLLLLVLALGLLAGCGTTTQESTTTATPAVAASRAAPTALTYPAVDVNQAGLEPTGLTDTGELAVPPLDQPQTIVYANWTPRLAGSMPTVLASHVNGRAADGTAIPGGFDQLAQARPGDQLTLTRADGTRTRYQVDTVDIVDKDTFPTRQVYRPAPASIDRLVLITCGGDINTAARSYTDNVIVTATPVG